MKKSILAFAALAFFAAGNAHAEFLFGMEGRSVRIKAGGEIIHAGENDRGFSFSPFIQHRRTLANGMQVGGAFHFGFGAKTAEFLHAEPAMSTLAATFHFREGGTADVDVNFDRKVTKSKIGRTFDLAALVAFPGGRVTPVAMLGWTSAKFEQTVAEVGTFMVPDTPGKTASGQTRGYSRRIFAESKTFSGWKVSGGFEFRFDKYWGGYALIDYAETQNGADNFTHSGVRAGIIHRF